MGIRACVCVIVCVCVRVCVCVCVCVRSIDYSGAWVYNAMGTRDAKGVQNDGAIVPSGDTATTPAGPFPINATQPLFIPK